MISVEQKYFVVFFIRWERFVEKLKDFSRSYWTKLIDESGPIILFGPILGRKFAPITVESVVLLVLSSLLMIGGPIASVFTLFFGLMGSAFYLLGYSALNILLTYFQGGSPLPGLGPVIPGVQVGPYYIPFFEGWLSILLIFLIHEGAHGAVALRRKIPIKDAAMVLLTFVPIAAYVMPDEERFLESDPPTKVSILSAGPTANVVAFVPTAILLLLLIPILTPVFQSYYQHYGLGVQILKVPKTIELNGRVVPSLVYGKLSPGDIILSINGRAVHTLNDVIKVLHSAEGNELTVVFLHEGKEKVIKIPNKGYLGVEGAKTVWKQNPPLSYHLLRFLFSFLAVFSVLNIAVAVINALPFSIFDGGQAAEELGKVMGVKIKPLKALALLLILINILPWFIT